MAATDLTLSYIEKQIESIRLKKLLGLTINDTILDTNDILVAMIARAESEFFFYMSDIFTFPLEVTDLDNETNIIQSVLSFKYAIFQYYLFSRVHENEELEQVLAEYNRVLSILKSYSAKTSYFSGLATKKDIYTNDRVLIKSNKTSSDKSFTDLDF